MIIRRLSLVHTDIYSNLRDFYDFVQNDQYADHKLECLQLTDLL